MPELPDVTVYVEHLARRAVGQVLHRVVIRGPFVLRTVDPPIEAAEGCTVQGVSRLGKRIVLALDGDLFIVIHLIIAGRLHWKNDPVSDRSRNTLALFSFAEGTLVLTEAGTKKRTSIHLVLGRKSLAAHDPGGIEPLGCSYDAFAAAMRLHHRTLKRALTDPAAVSGIGNAYSDEILHRAKLSPLARTGDLKDDAMRRLFDAVRTVLADWADRLRAESRGRWPVKVTAFRPGMAVHGRFGKPCPDCGTKVQRIVRAENEINYCPTCQTGGRVLRDRSLSRLLGDDWPQRPEDWE